MQGDFGSPIVKSASGNVKNGEGALLGFFCNSTSTGTVILYDDAATGTTTAISGTITPSAGTFYPFPAALVNGLNAVIANTLNVTFFVI